MSAAGLASAADRTSTRGTLAEDSVRQVLELLNRRFGFSFRDSFGQMARTRLGRRMTDLGLATLQDYYYRLLYDPDADTEFGHLFDVLSNNETYFFREETQIRTFAEEIVPAGGHTPGARVRAWSAGCSSGEEPYSLAIAVLEHLGGRTDCVEIFGSDYSSKVLEQARRGVYGAFSFRNLSPAMRDRYFEAQADGRHRINPDVRRLVQFGKCNLLGQAGELPLVKFDAIFCRNVLMYFDRDARRRVLDLFHDRLAPGGYLFLGHSESLLDLSDRFEVANLVNDVAYRR